MKKYSKFVLEDLEETKERIANQVETEQTTDDDKKKMELEEKPNDEINQDIEKVIEGFEKQKALINKKIDIFNGEIELSEDPDTILGLEEQIKKMEEELDNFDNMLKDATNQRTTLEDHQKE